MSRTKRRLAMVISTALLLLLLFALVARPDLPSFFSGNKVSAPTPWPTINAEGISRDGTGMESWSVFSYGYAVGTAKTDAHPSDLSSFLLDTTPLGKGVPELGQGKYIPDSNLVFLLWQIMPKRSGTVIDGISLKMNSQSVAKHQIPAHYYAGEPCAVGIRCVYFDSTEHGAVQVVLGGGKTTFAPTGGADSFSDSVNELSVGIVATGATFTRYAFTLTMLYHYKGERAGSHGLPLGNFSIETVPQGALPVPAPNSGTPTAKK